MAGNNLLDFLQGASNSAASNLSAPIDGINWLLRKAGLPVSDSPVGGSAWLAQKGLTAEPQNKIAGLLGEAFGGVAPIVVAAKAPLIAKGLIATEEAAKPVIANAAENYMLKTGMAQPIFVGKSSKTWDAAAAKKAEEMLANGVAPRQIWSETGTWKAPDGMWRQEVPDNSAKMDIQHTNHTTLPEFLDHSKLFDAYPSLNETNFKSSHLDGGRYRGGLDYIEVQDPAWNIDSNPLSTTLHEVQHAIQKREGFAGGGSPESASEVLDKYRQTKEQFDRALKQSLEASDPIAKSNAAQERQFYGLQLGKTPYLRDMTPHDAYLHLAGEAEARATQARLGMDAAQRRATFPEDSYDVPINQLIVRGLLGY